MDREHQPATTSNATESSPAASAVGKSTLTGGGGGEGAPESESPTIFRDLAPGGDAGAGGGAAVDGALGNAGRGQPHPSGASIHTDPGANAAAAELDAAAFTAGNDIYFGAGQYNPGTEQGDALMRHELAHVEQTRGLAPPTPGNYRVSDPGDAAEGAARDAEGGGGGDAGGAEGGTIHRKTNAEAGATPAPAATPPVDKLQEFFDALAGNNAADAKTKWAGLAAADKARMRSKKVASYPAGLKADPVESVMDVMGKDALPIMKEVKAAFDKLTYADAILNDAGHDAKYWMPALQANTLFNPWLTKLPSRAALTEARLTKLDPWMTEAAAVADKRAVFEQAYPKLKDTSYYPAGLKAAAWGADDIKRMWTSLQGKVPLAHVQTISGGFNLGTDEKLFTKNAKGVLVWNPLGFGWHDPGSHMVVMPKNSSNATGGTTHHDMTGGDVSGVAVAGTKADPKLTHWDGTMLHEIGHGVGDKTDGNTFAKTHGDWKGGMGWDVWSKALFDDAAATKALPTPPPPKVLSTSDARQFLAKEIANDSFLPAGWPRKDVVDFINAHYKDQNLVKYWDKVKKNTPAYYAEAHNHAGDRTYVWLQRGGLSYTNYKKTISDNKVSWYSISSTVEWFAEQYAHYYRTGKAGTGMDADAKKKLDEIDKMDATKTGGLAKATPGGAGPGGDAGATAEGDTSAGASAGANDTGEKGGAPPEGIDNSAEAVAARITRMNFE